MTARVTTALLLVLTVATAVPNEPIPLAGVFDSGSWAVADLVLACLAFSGFLLLAVVLLLRNYRNPANGGDSGADSGDADERLVAQMLMFAGALPWLITAAITAMLVVFLFAFSQDFSGLRLLYDKWSLTLAGLFIVQVFATVQALKKVLDKERSAQRSGSQALSQPDDSGMDDDRSAWQQTNQRSQQGARTPNSAQRATLRGGTAGQFEDDTDE